MKNNYPVGSNYMLQRILENLIGKSNYEALGTLNAIYQNLPIRSTSKISKEEVLGLKSLLGEVIIELNDSKKYPSNYIFELNDNLKYQEEDNDFFVRCL